VQYQAMDAWTWEHMALTRARVIAGDKTLARGVDSAIHATLTQPREAAKIAADVRDMRARVAATKGSDDVWDLKQVRGGLVDLEFIVQYLQLVHANSHPEVLHNNIRVAISRLADAAILSPKTAETLSQAAQLYGNLTQILRLCLSEPFEPISAPDGLKHLLASAANLPDFLTLTRQLTEAQSAVFGLFDELVPSPATD
jgi:[glutamine synthetase] adenylyltransferase / [glutamine synthetase]-adenylyl-L-tyrosine phosphorylase